MFAAACGIRLNFHRPINDLRVFTAKFVTTATAAWPAIVPVYLLLAVTCIEPLYSGFAM
jgi:hypothetical protein